MAEKTIYESAYKGDFETVSKQLEKNSKLLYTKDSVCIQFANSYSINYGM